jgi:predicted RND superfamily exporter protein
MVQVFPAKDIWNHENQREFIADLKRIMAPCEDKVTGTPVQLYEYTTLLKNSYQQAALYALAAIVVMVFLHFRSFTCVILSLLPVAIGSIWTGGFMGLLGIPFNPANVMTLPLVIGIGVTNGIHILNRVAEERNPGILAKSTGKAVLVSALTALTGFGSLTLAKHQGIQSLGLVMSMGIAACMIAGLTFLPAVINLLARRGWSVAKRPSSDNARSPLGLEEPR